MPLKVRCRECEKALSVPDSMRGKTVKCPQCGAKLKLPAGDGEEAPAKVAGKASKKKADEDEGSVDDRQSGEIFANLNLKNAESEEGRICAFCAEPMPDPEVSTVCPNCGMDGATGKMDKKEAKKRSRKGPDIKEFWGRAWSDPLQFVKEYKALAIRTGTFWLQFAFVFSICLFMAKDFCTRAPTQTFWWGLTIISGLGIPGWYWSLAIKLIQTELFREKVNTDRIHFDFFSNVALGMRAVIWPFVVFMPAWMGLGIVWLVSPDMIPQSTFLIIAGILVALPFLTFPLATIHMTARYQYKAWILWELLVTFSKCGAACFYWLLQAVVIMGPMAAILAAIQIWGGGLNPFTNTYVDQWGIDGAGKLMSLIGEQPNAESFVFLLFRIAIEFVFAFVMLTPLCYMGGFPALFMMRSNALLAYYFQGKLGIMNDMPRSTPATFWVRFLAFWGDMMLVPLSSFLVMRDKRAVMVGQLINGAMVIVTIFHGRESITFKILAVVFCAYNYWMYFAVSESGALRATTIKESFGLAVQTSPKGKQLSLKQATIRWFGSTLSALTFGLGFLMCAFNPKKKALQDILSKTEVVWVGDK